jgi:hypothetical protein
MPLPVTRKYLAYLLKSTLEGSGIEAFIPDEFTLRLNYPPIASSEFPLII